MRILLLVGMTCMGTFLFAQNQITWNAESDVSASNFGNNFPRIVKDGSGDPIVSWSDNADMYVATWNGTNFNTPIQLNPGGVTIAGPGWMGPDIASMGDTIYAVYKQTPEIDTSSHIWCVRSFDGGITYDSPVQVENIGLNISRFPTVSVDGQGHPAIGFMEFTPTMTDPQWVVVRSDDFGSSFGNVALASGWSSVTSEVCDCCPSKIISDGSTIAMPYRDNNSNIRDTWVGVSTDGGITFPSGMPVDQLNWSIMSCPSSGPDAVIVGDDLYTTYMSGVSGPRVYYSVSSISGMTGSTAISLDQTTPISLSSQNFPRVDYHDGSMAFAWKQSAAGNQEVAIQFTENITTGLNPIQEVVNTSGSASGVDLMLNDGVVWVVWEDESSGTVRYRNGQYNSQVGISEITDTQKINVYPNPAETRWIIDTANEEFESIELLSVEGNSLEIHLVYKNELIIYNEHLSPGVYFLRIKSKNSDQVIRLLKK